MNARCPLHIYTEYSKSAAASSSNTKYCNDIYNSHYERPDSTLWRPLLPYGYSYKASCARPGKASFVIFDIWALWRSPECPDVKNYKWRLNPVCHSTDMARVYVKGLNRRPQKYWWKLMTSGVCVTHLQVETILKCQEVADKIGFRGIHTVLRCSPGNRPVYLQLAKS